MSTVAIATVTFALGVAFVFAVAYVMDVTSSWRYKREQAKSLRLRPEVPWDVEVIETTRRCGAVECERVKGVDRPYTLCDYHKADFHAGVEIELRTGYALRKDVFGNAQIRAIRGKIEASEDKSAGALRQQPPAWHQHERTV